MILKNHMFKINLSRFFKNASRIFLTCKLFKQTKQINR